MNKPKFIFKLFLFLLIFSAANVFAQSDAKQPQAETCYEVVLQVLIASGNSSPSAVPANLTNAVKKLKTLYSYTDYRVSATFLQRTSNNVEYKSLLNDFNQNSDKASPVFSDWQLRGLRNLPNSQGRNTLQFEVFHFGARIPVVTGFRDDSSKTAMINYESIGITTSRFSLNENEPTIVGSLSTSKPDELMFLVLTVKPVSE